MSRSLRFLFPPRFPPRPVPINPHRTLRRWATVSLAAAVLCAALAPATARAGDGAEFFETKVRPVLAGHCYACHSDAAKKAKGGLRLDTPDGIRAGGDSGPVVLAKD